jgi:hypothetical protein
MAEDDPPQVPALPANPHRRTCTPGAVSKSEKVPTTHPRLHHRNQPQSLIGINSYRARSSTALLSSCHQRPPTPQTRCRPPARPSRRVHAATPSRVRPTPFRAYPRRFYGSCWTNPPRNDLSLLRWVERALRRLLLLAQNIPRSLQTWPPTARLSPLARSLPKSLQTCAARSSRESTDKSSCSAFSP